MADRNPPSGDPDDWFRETPELFAEPTPRSARPDDDAAGVERVESAHSAIRPLATRPRLIAAAAAGTVVLVLLGLAATGVFSSSRHAAAHTPATTGATTAGTTEASTPNITTRPRIALSTPLKPGNRGAEVKSLQRALLRLGYGSGSADGVYGMKTQAAVAKFQQAEGLTADGIAGPTTLRALRRKLAASG